LPGQGAAVCEDMGRTLGATGRKAKIKSVLRHSSSAPRLVFLVMFTPSPVIVFFSFFFFFEDHVDPCRRCAYLFDRYRSDNLTRAHGRIPISPGCRKVFLGHGYFRRSGSRHRYVPQPSDADVEVFLIIAGISRLQAIPEWDARRRIDTC